MSNEYLTISQFAKEAHRTKSAIYQRLDTSLKDYYIVRNGVRYIHRAGLSVFDTKLQDIQDDSNPIQNGVKDIQEEVKDIQDPIQGQIQDDSRQIQEDSRKLQDELKNTCNELENIKKILVYKDEVIERFGKV